MSFKDTVVSDIHAIFLNDAEFADRRTVVYDGEAYEDIPVVLTNIKEKDRRILNSDHAQGLYLVSAVMHCARSDLGGNIPEKGSRLKINDEEGGGGFFRDFYVAQAGVEMGMLRIELEGIDE